MAALILISTLVVAFLDVHTAALVIPVGLALGLIVAAAVVLQRRGWVVRLTEEGYRVQWVRGVGVAAARWKDVEDAVTTEVAVSASRFTQLRASELACPSFWAASRSFCCVWSIMNQLPSRMPVSSQNP